jgi:pyruvate ferredoxin oxidoreductase gamma subunit
LATAFFAEGKYVQAYATYGGARRGAPVSSFLRVSDKPIRLRCDIEEPDVIVCFDPSLLSEALLKGAGKNTFIIVNSVYNPDRYRELGDYRWVTVDGKAVAQRNGLGRIVNSALVGAFAGVVKAPDLKRLCRAVREMSPVKADENVKACLEGYELALKWEELVL